MAEVILPPDLEAGVSDGDRRLYSEDLAPTPASERHWGTYSLFSMWMSDIHSVGGYTFAASLFVLGLSGFQVLAAMAVGIIAVYFLMNLIGRPSLRTGVPYPVIARVSFGVFGANVAALTRAVIGIVWYGVQTFLASKVIVVMLLALAPGLASLTHGGFGGLAPLGWAAFAVMWALQLTLFQRGIEPIRRFIDFCGPAVYLVMFLLMIWVIVRAGWGHVGLNLVSKPLPPGAVLPTGLKAAALVVAYFSALLLNFGDFARFATTEQAMRRGNFLGLPVNFVVFALITVVVTSGSVAVFGRMVDDPVTVVQLIGNKWVTVLGCLTLIIATIGINIVANFVSPAYDMVNLWPEKIDFKRGGLITSVLSALVFPWNFFSSPAAIGVFVGTFGACLGPLYGIIIADYYLVKKQQVNVSDLYTAAAGGAYHYSRGFNPRAIGTLIVSVAVSAWLSLDPRFSGIGPYGWFIGAGLAAALYVAVCSIPAAGSDTPKQATLR